MILKDWNKLIGEVRKVQKFSYAPYSRYRVGSSILGGDGKIYSGCNVENASYGGSICAERTAIGKMVSAGCYEIKKLVVITESKNCSFPCGICLQSIREFASPNLEILSLSKNAVRSEMVQLIELLPFQFNKKDLNK